MNKDTTLEIKAINNGFIVDKTWKAYKEEANNFDYSYKSEQYMLATWVDVVEWVKNNELATKPKET